MPPKVTPHRVLSGAVRFVLALGRADERAVARRLLRAEYERLDAFFRREGLAFRADPRRVDAYVAAWEDWVRRRFDPRDPDRFYASWTGEEGALGLAVNVHDQLRRLDVLRAVRAIDWRGRRVLDVGAGSAAIHALTGAARERVLCDVENLSRRYVAFKLAGQANVRLIDPAALAAETPDSFDVVACIDVLEHLRAPSEVLRTSIEPLLRPGGLLILQAPWGGDVPEHLPEAPIDWRSRGGAALLAARFRRVRVLNPVIALYAPSGVYEKLTPSP